MKNLSRTELNKFVPICSDVLKFVLIDIAKPKIRLEFSAENISCKESLVLQLAKVSEKTVDIFDKKIIPVKLHFSSSIKNKINHIFIV